MGLVKNNTGLEEITQSLTNLENISTEVKASVNEVKTDTEGIVLSNASIKAIVDEIQNRIGLTADTGGSASAGSIMSKLNQIISSTGQSGGGITGFTYTTLEATKNTQTYTTKSSGFVMGKVAIGYSGGYTTSIYISNAKGSTIETYKNSEAASVFGIFTSGAAVTVSSGSRNATVTAHIFEFTI